MERIMFLCRKCFNKFKKKYVRWYAADAANAHKTSNHKPKKPEHSNQNLAQVNPQNVLSQVMESPVTEEPSISAPGTPDLEQICSMTGLTLEDLISKVNKATNTPLVPTSSPTSQHQRENHLELSLGLLDDYTDILDPTELVPELGNVDISPHWFSECGTMTDLRETVPVCDLCGNQHSGKEYSLTKKNAG